MNKNIYKSKYNYFRYIILIVFVFGFPKLNAQIRILTNSNYRLYTKCNNLIEIYCDNKNPKYLSIYCNDSLVSKNDYHIHNKNVSFSIFPKKIGQLTVKVFFKNKFLGSCDIGVSKLPLPKLKINGSRNDMIIIDSISENRFIIVDYPNYHPQINEITHYLNISPLKCKIHLLFSDSTVKSFDIDSNDFSQFVRFTKTTLKIPTMIFISEIEGINTLNGDIYKLDPIINFCKKHK